MSQSDKPLESLGEDRTRGGLLDAQRNPPASLGEEDTAGDRPSTSSDLDQFEEGWEEAEEAVDFETRYEVQETIGEGGMGQVVRALDRRLQREVAVKRLKEDTIHNPKAIQRFLTEARAVAGLNHFNIVQVHDVGRDKDGHYIVMELVAGESLAAAIARQGAFEPGTAVDIIAQVCNGLSAAHARGIVHRDIKPANILLTEAGIPKLADFGLARWDAGDGGHTRADAVLGTLDFMPPEQRRDARKTDARSDLWSLSATLYQMLTGDSPRVIRSERIPAALREVVLKALEDDPAARYPSAETFRDALHAAQSKTMEQQATAALQEGQCAKCGHANDLQLEFCQGCGAALRESCPGCTQPLPVWAKYCGKCGADVQAKLATRLAQLKREKQRIESLRTANNYGEAERRLKNVLKLKHSALAAYAVWAERTLRQVRSEHKQLQAERDRLFGIAEQRFTECQYAGAMHYLEQIPEAVRDKPVQKLMAMTGNSIRELEELGQAIPPALREKRYGDSRKLVDRYLNLKPEDPQANQLLKRLNRRKQAQATVNAVPGLVPLDDASVVGRAAPGKSVVADRRSPLTLTNYAKSPLRKTATATDGIPPWVYWIGGGVGVVLLAILMVVAFSGDSPDVASSDSSPFPSGEVSPSSPAPSSPAPPKRTIPAIPSGGPSNITGPSNGSNKTAPAPSSPSSMPVETPPAIAATDPMPKQPVTPSQPSAADVRGMDGGDDQPLVIREFKPRYGEAGDELTVSGRGFTDTQRVVFCYGREEQEARFTVESDTVLKVIVPIGIDDLRSGAAIEVVTAEGVTVTIPRASREPDPGGVSSFVRRSFAFTPQGQSAPPSSGNSFVMSGASSGKGVAARIYLQPGATIAENSVSATIYYVDVSSFAQNGSRPMVSCKLRKVPGVFPSFVEKVFNQKR